MSSYPEKRLSTGKQNCQATPESTTSTTQKETPSTEVEIFTCSRAEAPKKIWPHIVEASLLLTLFGKELLVAASKPDTKNHFRSSNSKLNEHYIPRSATNTSPFGRKIPAKAKE